MHFAILGSGAVGGYYGARLARAGQRVTFIARGAHLRAIRERGLAIWSPLGDFVVRAAAEDDASKVDSPDVILFAVKAYDNQTALGMIPPMLREGTIVLTLQNGVESAGEVAAVAGERAVIGGTTYIATALAAPGLIEQTGTHRRIVLGEVFGDLSSVSDRVAAIRDAMIAADIQAEAVADGRVPIWEKFAFLAPLAAFCGASRLPIGALWSDPETRETLLAAAGEVEAIARASGVPVAADLRDRIGRYLDGIPGSMRASLLIDLSLGKRIEVEALQGAVVRRGRALGIPTPMMAALYAVLKPYKDGPPRL
jgi:2-dehydropantoate 2-reductase